MNDIREVLIWPVGKEAEALSYADEADAAYAALTGNPEDVFCHRDRFDVHGQQVTAYFGLISARVSPLKAFS